MEQTETCRQSAPAGRLVTHEERELRLSTRWLLEGCTALAEELLEQCRKLQEQLDKADSEAVYDALDAREMADRLHTVLLVMEEIEEVNE